MLAFVLFLFIGVTQARPGSWESKQQYVLPEGAELLVGPVRSTFTCFNDGYYADVDNNCQIFHICYTTQTPEGSPSSLMYSFVCGNQTVFNQLTFTCTYPEDAVPCIHAQDFFYLNSHVEAADPEVHFLDDQDVQRAAPLIAADVYARRVEKPAYQQYQPVRRFDFSENHK